MYVWIDEWIAGHMDGQRDFLLCKSNFYLQCRG